MADRKIKILFVDMEYTRDEFDEPINYDVLLQSIKEDLIKKVDFSAIYRKLDSNKIEERLSNCDILMISTKISSFDQISPIINASTAKITLIGGVLATYGPEELAELYKDAIICISEGETNLNELIEASLLCSSVNEYKELLRKWDVKNICFWNSEQNKIYQSKRCVANLSKIVTGPIHHALPSILEKNGLVRMETSRGCPWNGCSFCVMPWRFAGQRWRPYPNSKITEEILQLLNNGVQQIYFTDEDFIGNFWQIKNLCSLLQEVQKSTKKKAIFGGSTSVYTLLQLGTSLDECLQMMLDTGIKPLFVGIESGCDAQLKRYNKGVSASDNAYIIKKLNEYNFLLDYGFILFDAETTVSELSENLSFINDCGLRSNMSRFAKKLRVVPHTVLCQQYKAKGYIINPSLNLNELYYEYKFLDSRIELICKYVEMLDVFIGQRSYQLQAMARGATDIRQKEFFSKELAMLRDSEYTFLLKCVQCYDMIKEVSEEQIKKIFVEVCQGCNNEEKLY